MRDFTLVDYVEALSEQLVETGLAVKLGSGRYRLTEEGEKAIALLLDAPDLNQVN